MQKDIFKMERPVIGVDVGGTKISAGLVEQNNLIKSLTFPTPVGKGREEVLRTIKEAVSGLGVRKIGGIGIGVPGLVDSKKGIVYDLTNIPDLSGTALKKELESTFGCPVEINNDANCFVLGVYNHPDEFHYRHLVGLTLGTGLGGGLILNGELYEGVGTGAGELGFLPYRDSILEHYCSGQFFSGQYGLTGKEAYARALKGDNNALKMFEEFGTHLGNAIKMVAHIFAPEAVVMGGSISAGFWLFEKSMWETIRSFPYAHVVDTLKVAPAVSPEIALTGAASLISHKKLHKK
jgi:glucokinase